MINVTIVGRLARNPELKQTQSGKSVATFSVASQNRGKDRGATFVDCVAWGAAGESIARYFTKGQWIALDGHLEGRQYQDRQGNNRTTLETIVDSWDFVGPKQETQAPPQTYAPPAQTGSLDDYTVIEDNGEDLPF